jgi:deoxycytidine triphosphate deaminase
VVPAIVHTDFYHAINVVLNLTGDRPFTLKHNTPIAQLVPFKRDSDFTKVLFNDESEFKYYANTGFGTGFISPKETGAPYRKERIRVDARLRENNKHRWWSRDKKK